MRQRFPLGTAVSGTGSQHGKTGGMIGHTHSGPSHQHTVPAHTHTMPAHNHVVPYSGWSAGQNTPPKQGHLVTGGSGQGSEASMTQAQSAGATVETPATPTGPNSPDPLVTNPDGSGQTGPQDPPFLTVSFLIKT
jgi:hypothetical protein